jgi:GTPase SAR1 family protein
VDAFRRTLSKSSRVFPLNAATAFASVAPSTETTQDATSHCIFARFLARGPRRRHGPLHMASNAFVCVVGANGSGRTAMCRRVATDTFVDPPPREDLSVIAVLPALVPDPMVMWHMRDLLGYSGFGSDQDLMMFMPGRYSGMYGRSKKHALVECGFVIVYDVTNRKSFDDVAFWLGLIDGLDAYHLAAPYAAADKSAPTNLPQAVLILGNKCDLDAERVVTREEGAALAATRPEYRHFAEVSAKTGEGVRDAVLKMADLMRAVNRPEGVRACRAAVLWLLTAARHRPELGLSRDTAALVARLLWRTRRDACWLIAANKSSKTGCAIQ